MNFGNTLVVHVVSVRGLQIKGNKPVDVYCSLSTSGKGPWKSKVSTNSLKADPQSGAQELRWDEHCEFHLNETDAKVIIHVNHKTVFGTTETLGELIFHIEQMLRFQPAAWFRLVKAGSADDPGGKERGQIQLGYQFSNSLGTQGTSISNISLNKIDNKEKKFHRFRRKMAKLGRKATGAGGNNSSSHSQGDDTQSLASISIAAGQHLAISRRSSISSTNSGALAFSSPSPHPPTPMPGDEARLTSSLDEHRQRTPNLLEGNSSTAHEQQLTVRSNRLVGRASIWSNAATPSSANYANEAPIEADSMNRERVQRPQSNDAQLVLPDPDQKSIGGRSSLSGGSVFGTTATSTSARSAVIFGQSKELTQPASSQKLRDKMRQKAEQLLQLRSLAGTSSKKQQQSSEEHQRHDPDFGFPDQLADGRKQRSRRDSVASSSGFVSFGSGQLSALNEQTTPVHLLNVIAHLRRELLKKEDRIRDLEEYCDQLVTKVMLTNPELLAAASPKPGSSKIRR